MGKYTKQGQFDDFIQNQLDILVAEIKKAIPEVISIILMGGYGRGEGAIKIKEDGQPQLINDFDIYIITEKYIPDDFLEKLALRCSKLLGKGGIAHPEAFEEQYNLEKFFHIDIRCLVRKRLKNLLPTIRYYEMKHNSTVLWGENILKEFPTIKIEDIPKSEALRIIMNRMMLLLMAFKPEFLQKKINSDEKQITFYYITKSYLTIVESLLLFTHNYQPTYSQRTEVFNQIFSQTFPSLAKQLPDLVEKVNFYTQFKFQPQKIDDNPIVNWHKCRQSLGIVFYYCLEIFFGKKLPTKWVLLVEELKSNLAKKYFNSYINYILKKYRLNNLLLEKLGVFAVQIFMSFKYFWLLKKDLGKFYWPALSLKDPGIKILYILPLILYAIEIDGQQNQKMLSLAVQELKNLYPIDQNQLDWSTVKSIWLKAYRLYYLQRFV